MPGAMGLLFFFLKKLQFIFKPPGEVSWGSPGGLGSSWGAVGLEKLVDSMTCKLFPATKIHLAPLLGRSGMVPNSKKNTFSHVSMAVFKNWPSEVKKSQKTKDNDRFYFKKLVFGVQKWTNPRDGHAWSRQVWTQVEDG